MSMPSTKRILSYWKENHASRWPDLTQSYDWGEPCCWVCFAPFDDYSQLDRAHLKARCVGGSDDPSNLILACRRCNLDMDDCHDSERSLAWVRAHAGRPPWRIEIERVLKRILRPVAAKDMSLFQWLVLESLYTEISDGPDTETVVQMIVDSYVRDRKAILLRSFLSRLAWENNHGLRHSEVSVA